MKHKCMHGPAGDDASPSIGDQREIGSVGLLCNPQTSGNSGSFARFVQDYWLW